MSVSSMASTTFGAPVSLPDREGFGQGSLDHDAFFWLTGMRNARPEIRSAKWLASLISKSFRWAPSSQI
jgi:hypothetical protein